MLNALSEELDRNFRVLKQNADPAPYFLAYEVTEQDVHLVGATLGSLTSNASARNRYLDVSLRVGSPKLDNYHRVRGEWAHFTSGTPLALDDNARAIKQFLWLETDRAYRAAAERLIKIRTNTQVNVAEEDASNDFSQEEPSVAAAAPPRLKFDSEYWSARLRKLSGEFSKFPAILTSSITVVTQTENKYFASTEGSRLQHGRGFARLMIAAQSRAQDGMDLATIQSFDSTDPGGLSEDSAVHAAIEQVAHDLNALLHAPVADPFVGPAIFSGYSAGVFFHEIFGHRVEGHRQKDESDGQTFTRSVGTRVLPEFLTVIFDPTRRKIGGTDLNGWYANDDEGIKARSVTVVEKGLLKTFLMSRSPIKGFDHSNGHGRRQPGLEVVSRQSNLVVESSKTVSESVLRKMLLEEVKRQNKPYGLFFKQVTGGFTATARSSVQAFKVLPILVYRVYADGRQDELVRGADIVGTPLASFAKILATSDTQAVFNGYCNAESGNVPVSAVSPAILVSEIEIQKREQSQDRPPLLPMPPDSGQRQ